MSAGSVDFSSVRPSVGEKQAERAAERRHQHAFGDELANDAMARGTHRCANGDFFFADGRAREREVGDVGARDQQNENDGDEQDQEPFANVADQAGLQRDCGDVRIPGFRHGPRKQRGDLRLEKADFGVGLLHASRRDAGARWSACNRRPNRCAGRANRC